MDSDPHVPAAQPARDPLAGLDAKRLARFARRATRLRERDPEGFSRMALRAGVPIRRLRLLSDAWCEGGPAGLQALGPAPADTEPVATAAIELVLSVWCRLHYPLGAVRWDRWRNRVTIWQLKPLPRVVAHLRRSGPDRWHLYRKAGQGEWWPVRVGELHDLHACLNAVREDPLRVFWTAEDRFPVQDPGPETAR